MVQGDQGGQVDAILANSAIAAAEKGGRWEFAPQPLKPLHGFAPNGRTASDSMLHADVQQNNQCRWSFPLLSLVFDVGVFEALQLLGEFEQKQLRKTACRQHYWERSPLH